MTVRATCAPSAEIVFKYSDGIEMLEHAEFRSLYTWWLLMWDERAAPHMFQNHHTLQTHSLE